jgi:protein-disulfide isomerase
VPKLDDEYIKTGKLRYVVRDLPLESIHPQAFKAAEATHCAAEQGKYWELHDRLFANQQQLDRAGLGAHARALGLDGAAFDRCLDGGKYAERVRKDVNEAQRLGIGGTPTFLVGVMDGGQLKGVRMIRGAQPYPSIKATIDELLSAAK